MSQINEGTFEKMSRNSEGEGVLSMTELNRKESEMTDPSSATTEQAAHRLQIEYWPLDRLIPYARNARTHSPGQVA